LKAFRRLSNCSLVTVMMQSFVLGTAALTAGAVSARHSPRTVITAWLGESSGGLSSGFFSVGGVGDGVPCVDGFAMVGAACCKPLARALVGAAVATIRQMTSPRIANSRIFNPRIVNPQVFTLGIINLRIMGKSPFTYKKAGKRETS
jgi:hypothetical protein